MQTHFHDGSNISVKWADILQGRYVIDFHEHEYHLVLEHGRLCLFDSSKTPLGVIRMESPTSGGVWLSGEVVGEYRIDPDGHYKVCPIEDGFKLPQQPLDVNPLVHLLTTFRAR